MNIMQAAEVIMFGDRAVRNTETNVWLGLDENGKVIAFFDLDQPDSRLDLWPSVCDLLSEAYEEEEL